MVRVSKRDLMQCVDEILRIGDLDNLTTKKIRLICEKKYNTDLSSRRDEIDAVVSNFIYEKSGKKVLTKKDSTCSKNSGSGASEDDSSCSSGSGSESCTDSDCSSSQSSEDESASKNKATSNKAKATSKKGVKGVSKNTSSTKVKATAKNLSKKSTLKKAIVSPKKPEATNSAASIKKTAVSPKKQNAPCSSEQDDVAYARQLQAAEFSFRQRTSKKLFPDGPKKETKTAKNKSTAAYSKKCALSAELTELFGINEMSRQDVIQKMWAIVKERNLLDKRNQQYAICDEQLSKIFGRKKFRMIGMMKYLKHHIKNKK